MRNSVFSNNWPEFATFWTLRKTRKIARLHQGHGSLALRILNGVGVVRISTGPVGVELLKFLFLRFKKIPKNFYGGPSIIPPKFSNFKFAKNWTSKISAKDHERSQTNCMVRLRFICWAFCCGLWDPTSNAPGDRTGWIFTIQKKLDQFLVKQIEFLTSWTYLLYLPV